MQGSGGAPDSFVGTSGVDSITLIDSLGNFDLVAKGADDVVTILATEDVVTSDASARGGDGNDTFLTLGDFSQVFNNSFFNGNAGNDALNFSGDTLAGTTLLGGKGDDIITTGAAISSRFNGNIGDDTLDIDGTSSNSSFFGGQDDDTIDIVANVTNSLISGDDGDDTITAGIFNLEGSTLNGGDGDDVIDADAATSSVLIDGGDGENELDGGDDDDTIIGGDDDDEITGGGGNDVIATGDGSDTVFGGAASGTAASGSVAGASLVFANGVDTVTGFTLDSIYDLNTDDATVVVNARTTAIAAAGDAFFISGTYNAATDTFGYASSGSDVYVGIATAAALANSLVFGTTSANGAVIVGAGSFFSAADLLA